MTVVAGNAAGVLVGKTPLITADLVRQQQVKVRRADPFCMNFEAAGIHGDDGMSGATVRAQLSGRPATRRRRCWTLPIKSRSAHPGHPGAIEQHSLALLIDPQLLNPFQHTYMMVGAADGIGNANAVAEFNAWVDPEAAAGFRRTRREDHDRLGCAEEHDDAGRGRDTDSRRWTDWSVRLGHPASGS